MDQLHFSHAKACQLLYLHHLQTRREAWHAFSQSGIGWFMYRRDGEGVILNPQTGLIWQEITELGPQLDSSRAHAKVRQLEWAGLANWRLPTRAELIDIAYAPGFPLCEEHAWFDCPLWLYDKGCVYLDQPDEFMGPDGAANMIAVDDTLCADWPGSYPQGLFELGWTWLGAWTSNARFPKSSKFDAALTAWKRWRSLASSENDGFHAVDSNATDWPSLLRKLDYISTRLPDIDSSTFTDAAKGLWELWPVSDAKHARRIALSNDGQMRARNPELDIRDANVAIDFGTSSTVVAFREGAHDRLLRIGESNLWEQPQASDYENPTVLEVMDWQALMAAWTSEVYRPLVDWRDIHCAHEARDHLRDNHTDPKRIASIFSRMKQWALDEFPTLISDQIHQEERILPPFKQYPSKKVDDVYADFNPIELYAWFLGMFINWRQRGIFLRYYMTFPVSFPHDTKEKILSAFHHGLQRSLPESLVYGPHFAQFRVEERGSEPAAYAACALKALQLAPSAAGVGRAFAVFDFGGGTTDFDFGYYRLPDKAEAEAGWEEVIEHFGASGDRMLGGEQLLENLAYISFRHNLPQCREHKIAFLLPQDAEDFAGSDMFLEKTRSAQTNSIVMMGRLRSFCETGNLEGLVEGDICKMPLLNRDGLKVDVAFQIPQNELRDYLRARIERGAMAFFAAMQAAFKGHGGMPAAVDVLLAGNACRSPWVMELFGLTGSPIGAIMAFEQLEIVVHPPLLADPSNPWRPTAKTGVALGLLRLCPGETLKVINLSLLKDDAPFLFSVGKLLNGEFAPCLPSHGPYGLWHEVGRPLDGVFNLAYTHSPRARTDQRMDRSDPDLRYRRIDFPDSGEGQKVYSRAIAPNLIQICLAHDLSLAGQPEPACHFLQLALA
jgi:hypothetical protein